MNIDVIKKVLQLNGFFEAKGKVSVNVNGYGNIQSAYSHVTVRESDNKYYIECYVTNERGRIYRPFGITTIIIYPPTGKHTCDIEIRENGQTYLYKWDRISLPAYFSETAEEYVTELVYLLCRNAE